MMLRATLSFGEPPAPVINSALAMIGHPVIADNDLMAKSGVLPIVLSIPAAIASCSFRGAPSSFELYLISLGLKKVSLITSVKRAPARKAGIACRNSNMLCSDIAISDQIYAKALIGIY